MWYFFLLASIP